MHSFRCLLTCAALIGGAVLGGCGTSPDGAAINLTFDPCQPIAVAPTGDLDSARLTSIDHALAMWNDLGVTDLSRATSAVAAGPSSGDGAGPQVIPIEFQRAAVMFYGLYDDQHGVVYINRSLEDDHQRAVTIAHELGHAFGLVHVPASVRPSVMNPGNLTVEPTLEDAAAVTSIWGDCGRS